jgi:beta-lactamase class A
VEDLNKEFSIATDDAELTEGTMTFPVSQALNQLITISHNYAALLLSDKIGLSNVQTLIHENGLTSSTVVAPPRTTAHDIVLFYEKLYDGQLIDRNYSNQMLDLLKKQTLNDRIPAELPEGTVVAHKTGELDGYKHDAGIVYGPKGEYIIVMMSNTQDPQIAVQKMADLSKQVYDYFEK